ncbi:Nucleotidyltransferase domain protein [compost metagenome]
MKFGLSNSEYEFLMSHLVAPLKEQGAHVFLFGSRATGKHRPFSDIDLLFTPSPQLTNAEVFRLLSTMEESSFPYKVDLVNEHELAHSYRDSVDKDKIEL